MELIDFILHVDRHLAEFIVSHGVWVYALLFLIVFVETGVVVMPLLPGDSLLFAAGALAAAGRMDPWLLGGLLFAAAVLGDNTNYFIGRLLGPRVYGWNSRWLRREYLMKTQEFFLHHGGKTVIIARFMPIVRTFTPFVAGVGAMPYRRFLAFDVAGGALWVGSCVGMGYGLGNLPFFKDHFSGIVLAIIFISLLPGLIAWARQRIAPAGARKA
ncbi:MAG TPA: DedA family protein [Moraxellaceae bacterium]|nr:DedA family protein [Moraxellaceae bacterium]